MELNFYNKIGEAVCYLTENNDIYAFNGRILAYIDGDSIYAFDGNHLGWFINNWIIDHDGFYFLFCLKSIGGPIKPFMGFTPSKSIREWKPYKGYREYKPYRPTRKYSWSSHTMESFFKVKVCSF